MTNATPNAISDILSKVKICEDMLSYSKQLEKFDAFLAISIIGKMDKQTLHLWERHRMALALSWSQQPNSMDIGVENYIVSWEAVKDFLSSELEIHEMQNVTYANMIKSAQTPQSDQDIPSTSGTASNVQKAQKQADQKPSTSQTNNDEKKKVPEFLQCKLCNQIHPLYSCEAFKAKTRSERVLYVTVNGLCIKYLRPEHSELCRDRNSNNPCPICLAEQQYHNSMLCPSKKRSWADQAEDANK